MLSSDHTSRLTQRPALLGDKSDTTLSEKKNVFVLFTTTTLGKTDILVN